MRVKFIELASEKQISLSINEMTENISALSGSALLYGNFLSPLT
jgi:hypothetical protein